MKVFYGPAKDKPKDTFYAEIVAVQEGSNYYGKAWTDVEIVVKRNHHTVHHDLLRVELAPPQALVHTEKRLRSIPL